MRPPLLTGAFVAAQVAANAAAGSIAGPLPPEMLGRWGVGVDAVLGRGEAWRLATATLLSHDAGMLGRQVAFAALALGAHEALWGARRTAATFAATGAGATMLVLGGLAALGPAADGAASLHDVGMSAGGFGILGALAAGSRWPRAALALGLGAVGAKMAWSLDPLADPVHVAGLLGGWAIGRAWPARRA